MATKNLLLVPTTLCFLLLLAAQGTEASDKVFLAVFQGQTQCRNNPGTVISNATVQVVINGSMVIASGQTTTDGKFSLMVKVNGGQMTRLLSNTNSIEAVLTSPLPQACAGGATRPSAPMAMKGFGVFGAPSKVKAGLHNVLHHIIGNSEHGDDAAGGVLPSVAAADAGGLLVLADAVALPNDDTLLNKCNVIGIWKTG